MEEIIDAARAAGFEPNDMSNREERYRQAIEYLKCIGMI